MTDWLTEAKTAAPQQRNWFRPQDFAWVLFVAILIATSPERNYDAVILLPLIGAFQVLEPRFPLFSSRTGQITSVVLKMTLSYLLIGFSHGAESYYSPILLIPVVSAATIFELPGVIAVTAIACAAYFSFLLPGIYDYSRFELTSEQLSLMSLRAAFYAIVAFVVYDQAKAKRDEMQRTREAATQLAESNQNLRRAEASLRRSERLAALGQLTAGLAHELRNPLGTIRASAEMLTKQIGRDRPDVMTEMAEYIRSEVDRMNLLIGNFLDFARPLKVHRERADLQLVLNRVVREQTDLALSRRVLITTQTEGSQEFTFDPELLRLALSNLVQNALQASLPGKQVVVAISSSSDEIKITVSDNGEGIPQQNMESIFNPFFTTKPKGVGLGLAIVSKIVDEHGGRISVRSEPGAGTRFEITLPKEQAA